MCDGDPLIQSLIDPGYQHFPKVELHGCWKARLVKNEINILKDYYYFEKITEGKRGESQIKNIAIWH